MSGDKSKTLYHYTDKESAKKIKESGQINKSQMRQGGDDVTFGGNKAYLTSKGPETSKHDLAYNHFDGPKSYQNKMIGDGKLDVAIKLDLPKNEVKREKTKRDIYTHEGDIKLDKAENVEFIEL